jgi:hypothetical protein
MATVSQNYEFIGPKVNMFVSEGTFSDDNTLKAGGKWASEITQSGILVKLTSSDLTVAPVTTSTDTPIGFLEALPAGGDKTAGSSVASVALFGVTVKEIECATASAIALGAHVKFDAIGGTFGQGTFVTTTDSNGTIALESYATASGAGQRILVLFGAYSI